jgi:hypothetical protein
MLSIVWRPKAWRRRRALLIKPMLIEENAAPTFEPARNQPCAT